MTRVTIFGLLSAVALAAACGNNTPMNGTPDMAMVPPGSDLAMTPADMATTPPDMVPPKLDTTGCAAANVTASAFYGTIVSGTCTTPNGCHGTGGTLPVMDTMANFIANTKGKQSSNGMNYVTANDVDKSYLLYKVTGQHVKVTQFPGVQMPSGKTPYTAAQQCQMINWVKSGAN